MSVCVRSMRREVASSGRVRCVEHAGERVIRGAFRRHGHFSAVAGRFAVEGDVPANAGLRLIANAISGRGDMAGEISCGWMETCLGHGGTFYILLRECVRLAALGEASVHHRT